MAQQSPAIDRAESGGSPQAPASAKDARRVIFATFLGTTVEWYDFFLYAASAALIFGPQFFPDGDPVAAQIGAFATFAFGFISRPLGGILAGHFGDKIGRKGMLVLSLLVMGIATAIIGLLPTFESVGLWAPVLLTVLRLAQGLGVGAEWGGAVTMAVEYAPPHRKALYGAAPMIGLPAGLMLSNLVLIVLGAITGPAFTEWGWRIAFLFSIVLVAVGIWTRYRLNESPVFEKAMQQEKPKTVPFLSVLRHYFIPLVCTILISGVPSILAYLVLTWALSYGTGDIGYSRDALLWIGILCCVIQLIMIPALAVVVDKLNPRIVGIVGAIVIMATSFLFFPLFETGNIVLAAIGTVLAHASTSVVWAVVPSILSRAFPGSVRYTGVSMAYQFGAIVGGGFAPMIATSLLAATGATLSIATYSAGAAFLMLVAIVGLYVYYRARRNEPDWD